MRNYFRKREGAIEPEQQLAELALCGVVLDARVAREQLLAGHVRAEIELPPFRRLLQLLAGSSDSDAIPPCPHLCRFDRTARLVDAERGRQLARLATMCELAFVESALTSDVDGGMTIRAVLGTWRISHRLGAGAPALALPTWFDGVLASVGHPRRLYRCYAGGRDFGVLAALAGDEPQDLMRLTGLRLDPLSITGITVPVERV